MDDKTLRRVINNELHWCISGTEVFGKAHIAKNHGHEIALCGASVESRNQVRWRDLCKSCRRIAVRIVEAHLTQRAADAKVRAAEFEELKERLATNYDRLAELLRR